MKNTYIALGAILSALPVIALPAFAQPFSAPVKITTGNSNDIHPVLPNAPDWWFVPDEEWLAFSRNGKNILLMKTTGRGIRWPDTTYTMTTDSMDNDYPSLTRAHLVPFQSYGLMLVWQSRKFGNLDIFYSLRRDTSWTSPQPLTTDPADDRMPQVTYRDSGFAVVWERGGRILFSEFVNNQWSVPEFVTPPGDTLNALPDVEYVGIQARTPMVVWERSKSPAPGSAIMYSLRQGTAWRSPDTIQSVDDNRRPRFFKVRRHYANFAVSWSSTARGETRLLIRDADYVNNTLSWHSVFVPPQFPDINTDAAFNGTLIISEPGSPATIWYSVGVWTNSGPAGNGKISALHAFASQPINITGTMPGISRNPDIAAGVFRDGAYHIWAVWENNRDSVWKLYGSYISYGFLNVDDRNPLPSRFALHQNYPNPFNPTTRIEYAIPKTSHVSLKVFDVLGREITTLIDGIQDAGFKSVQFEGRNIPSGVYFYRLSSGQLTETKTMILIR